MKLQIVVVVEALLLLCSCKPSSQHFSTDIVKEKLQIEQLDTINMVSCMNFFSPICGVSNIDQYLILVQENRDTLFRVIDSSTDSLVASFGRVGHAHNEFQEIPINMYCRKDQDGSPLLYIQETLLTKVVDLKKSISANKCIIKDIIKEKYNSFFYRIYHLDGDNIFIHKKLSYQDPRDEIFFQPEYSLINRNSIKWNIYPEIIHPKFKNIVDCAYDNVLTISPDCLHALSVSNFIDIITTFDLQKNLTIGIINPAGYDFEYLENEITSENVSQKLRWYNTSVCSTNDRFIVIEDGGLYSNNETPRNSIIRSYDWNGNTQFAYKVNMRLSHIAYFEKCRKLYAIESYEKLHKYSFN